MKLQVLPEKYYSEIEGRSWGYLSPPEQELPDWASAIPWSERLRFLATGPDFFGSGRDDNYITSNKLIGPKDKCSQSGCEAEELSAEWYLLVGDKDLNNVLLMGGPFSEHEDWIRELSESSKEVLVYLVPKHPEQDSEQ